MVLLFSYAIGLLPGLVAMVYLLKRDLSVWNFALLPAPLLVWEATRGYIGVPGSLANALAEPLLLGTAASLLILAAAVAARRKRARAGRYVHVALLIASITGLVFAWLFPVVPE